MASDLQAGDMCVVINANWTDSDYERAGNMLGRTVILTKISELCRADNSYSSCPHWHAVGFPGWLTVSWKSLRKLPPPEELEEVEDDETIDA